MACRQGEPKIAVTHDEMALELGTAREVISRLLKEFERRGAIRLARGRIVILDEDVLTDFAADRSEDPTHGLRASFPHSG